MVEVPDKPNRESRQFPEIVPVLPLDGMVVFPLMLTPLSVDDPRDLRAIDAAVASDRYLLLVALKNGEETPRPDTIHEIGSIATIHKMMQLPDEARHLVLRSHARVRIVEFVETTPVLRARIEVLEETGEDAPETRTLFHTVLKSFERLVELSPYLPKEAYVQALNVHSASSLADLVASALPIRGDDQQRLLAMLDVTERLRMVHRMAQEALTTLEIADRVGSTAREEIEKNQREYFLREQLKAIQRELGQETEGEELNDLRARLEGANLPEEARRAADREIARLERMNPAAAEYSVVRTYLEWMSELPWSKSSEEIIDVDAAQKVLDEDHYDLEEVKDRIVEYLAVRKIKQELKGPILCFVGPPGVGKTSLGRSIARATGREFVRMSLGGVRDEAEIRGHRRTYVGALPGRIIRAVRDAGTNNPVIMLDEVDKLGADFRGDPSSALLEVLDPAQNSSFSDHYLEVPFDLSQVMFICTANVLQTIPAPLLDRMEVIQLAGYTEEEKVHIAKRYLIPRQREEHGLTAKQLRITDAALRGIIGKYTRESGVRNLERQIGTVCRKIARRVAAGDTELPTVTNENLETFLGRQKIFPEACDRVTVPGVVTGLAWTQTGGEILFIEATRMPGQKGFKLTGQLGDVMQESADAALSYVRSNAEKLGIEPDFFDSSDIHIHVPSGAVPKDGPSAGVAMVTALVSLLTGRRVKCNVGMTGEITLRGKVLPIGGVKEKSLAARRAGLDTVILPLQNQGDVRELSDELRGDLKFIFAETIGDVLSAALEGRLVGKA